jgi:hypothetical protein
VVAAPKTLLLDDVAAGTAPARGTAVQRSGAPGKAARSAVQDPDFPFTREQLEIYGIYELQTLEEVLRQQGPQSGETRREVARRIQNKIGWAHGDEVTRSDAQAARFLKAFYAALRAHLETRMLFGERRENKYDGKAGGKTGPDGGAKK